MASTRPLILWLLERGHQPQALRLDMAFGADDWLEAVAQEADVLQSTGEASLRQAFLEQLSQLGHDLTETEPESVWQEHSRASGELSDELRQVLEQAIALRDQGNPDAALNLLEQQAAVGVRNPWLADNLARCLVNLNRKAEALTIWQALATSADVGIAEQAADMAAQVERGLVGDLIDKLQAIVSSGGESLQHEQLTAETSFDALTTPVLEEAIRLREAGQPSYSLEVLRCAEAAGLNSPWLQENQARALVHLDRRDAAVPIWETLTSSGEPNAVALASEMLEVHRPKLVGDLNRQLRQQLEREGRVVRHLPETAPSKIEELELPVLQEAIDLREQGDAELSLGLLDTAKEAGLGSGWIDDNRARVLVNLDRYSEAMALWQQLQVSGDAALEQAASEMLEMVAAKGREQQVLVEVEELLNNASDPASGQQQALERLTDAVLENPDCDAWQQRLRELAAAGDSRLQPDETGFPELNEQRKVLAGFDALLSVVERRVETRMASKANSH